MADLDDTTDLTAAAHPMNAAGAAEPAGMPRIGVLLPNGVPGCAGATVLEWARRADAGPFTSIGVADRYVYANHEPMMTLAAAAAVTSRVRLLSAAILPALRPPVLFAKQAATLAALAPGRVTLGVAVGNRRNDFDAAGLAFAERGAGLDTALAHLAALRDHDGDDNSVGPALPADVEVLIGGASPPALRRLLDHGHGLVSGGVRPEVFAFEAYAACETWRAAGRPGRPRLVASTWYASSAGPDDLAAARLASYLRNGGPPEPVLSGISRGADGIAAAYRAYRAQGADEVLFFPLLDDVAELDWLAGVVAGLPAEPRGEPHPDFAAAPTLTGRHA